MPKTLTANGSEFIADIIIKTEDSIIGYKQGNEIPEFSFKGISDFSDYSLTEGEEYDIVPKTEANILREELTASNTHVDQLTLELGDAMLNMVPQKQVATLTSQVEELTVALGDALLNGGI